MQLYYGLELFLHINQLPFHLWFRQTGRNIYLPDLHNVHCHITKLKLFSYVFTQPDRIKQKRKNKQRKRERDATEKISMIIF